MERFVLQARRVVGPLCAPVRNDTETLSGHDRVALSVAARGLVQCGFTAWLFQENPAVRAPSGLPALDLVESFTPRETTS